MDYQTIVNKVRKDLASRDEVIRELYTDAKLKNTCLSYVLKNGGDKTDAEDLMTFGVVSFIKQCYKPQFELKNNPGGYIFTIIKYEWMRRSKSKMHVVPEENRPELSSGANAEELIIGEERMATLRVALKKLSDKCREVLTMWSSSMKMREIALNMDYKSEGMARKKKHECLGKLKMIIKDI